jgi:hypothetical protein
MPALAEQMRNLFQGRMIEGRAIRSKHVLDLR